MYGSDWPVFLVAANYDEQLGVARNYFLHSASMNRIFFGENATSFYNFY